MHVGRLALGCGVALVLSGIAWAGDWTEFRGPGAQGHTASKNLPIKWTEQDNIVWKQELPGKAWSSPILLGSRLYLTNAVQTDPADAGQQSLRTLCVDASSGKVLWDVEVFAQDTTRPTRIHGKNSHASPTPITDGKRIFVHFGTQGTACLDLDGKIVWSTREHRYTPVHGNGGSPVLVKDLLVFSCDGGDVQFVVALDQNTGKQRWKFTRPCDAPKKFSFSTPLVIEVNGKQQIVSSGTNSVSGLDPASGEEIWRVRYTGYSVVPRPVFGQGLLFICTGYDSPSVLAIRPDGKGDVTDTHVAWTLKRGAPLNPSPLLVGEELYLISDQGVATCLNARTGEQHWQQRVGGNYSSSPLYADGKIYFQSEAGEGIVIAADRTEFRELSRNPLNARSLASYAVGDKELYIRTEKYLARVEAK